MNDKREDARRMAEQLIAEESRGGPHSATKAYLIAAVIGLVCWAMIYFVWRGF